MSEPTPTLDECIRWLEVGAYMPDRHPAARAHESAILAHLRSIPALTARAEAARERLLPGSTILIESGAQIDGPSRWFSCALTVHRDQPRTLWPSRSTTERHARLAALLLALAAKVEGESGHA